MVGCHARFKYRVLVLCLCPSVHEYMLWFSPGHVGESLDCDVKHYSLNPGNTLKEEQDSASP
jgi:hypothetical protein